MTPYEMGKYAALQELGLEKDAGLGNFFTGVGRGLKNLWKGEGAAADAAKAVRSKGGKGATKGVAAEAAPAEGVAVEGAAAEEAAKDVAKEVAAKPAEKGLLASLPWWVKGMGLAGLGYGGYKMLSPDGQGAQGAQQTYFGPGNAYPQGF